MKVRVLMLLDRKNRPCGSRYDLGESIRHVVQGEDDASTLSCDNILTSHDSFSGPGKAPPWSPCPIQPQWITELAVKMGQRPQLIFHEKRLSNN